MANEQYHLTKDELKLRLEYIIAQREAGKTYQWIADSLIDAGFHFNVSKMRIRDLMEVYRPDLLGRVCHLREDD